MAAGRIHEVNPMKSMDEMIFKKCPGCSCQWSSQDLFLSDPTVKLTGYKADFETLDLGLFFFTHSDGKCGSTMALQVKDFRNLYHGNFYPDRRTGSPECPLYCKDQQQLNRCDALCECAFAREIMQIIKHRHQA